MNPTRESEQEARLGLRPLRLVCALVWVSLVAAADEVPRSQSVSAPLVAQSETAAEAEDPFLMEGSGAEGVKPKLRLCQVSLARLFIVTGVLGSATAWTAADHFKKAKKRRREKLLEAAENGDLGWLRFQWLTLPASEPELAAEIIALAIRYGYFSLVLDLLDKTDPIGFSELEWGWFASEFLAFKELSVRLDWTLGKKIFENAPSDYGPPFLRRALSDHGPAFADQFFEPGRDYSENKNLYEAARVLINQQDIVRLAYLEKVGALKRGFKYLTLFAVRSNKPEALAFLMEKGGELPKTDLAGSVELLRKSKSLLIAFSDHAAKPEASVPGLRSLASAIAKAGDLEQMAILLDPKHGRKDLANEFFAVAIAHMGTPETLKIFFDSGADIHFGREAALRSAVSSGSFWILKPLIEAGADIHVNNEEPLRLAIKAGESGIARFLIKRGADPKVAAENE